MANILKTTHHRVKRIKIFVTLVLGTVYVGTVLFMSDSSEFSLGSFGIPKVYCSHSFHNINFNQTSWKVW